MTAPTLSIPVAVLLSLGTAVGGAWVAVEKTQAAMSVRMDVADKRLDVMQLELRGFVPSPEFQLGLADLKSELDEIRGDVKEIRHEHAEARR